MSNQDTTATADPFAAKYCNKCSGLISGIVGEVNPKRCMCGTSTSDRTFASTPMTNQDWTPPDVVWIDKETLVAIQDCKSTTGGYVGIPDASELDVELGDTLYTLTTTAEANTRKSVREALERVKQMESIRSDTNNPFLTNYIDQLLTQYQEPQSTEANDDPPT